MKREDILLFVVDGNLHDEESDEYLCFSSQGEPVLEEKYRGSTVLSLWYQNKSSTFMKKAQTQWRKMAKPEQQRVLSDSVLLLILSVVAMELTDADTHEPAIGCVMDYCETPSELLEGVRIGFRFCKTCCRCLNSSAEGRAVLKSANRLREHPYRSIDSRTIFLSYAWKDEASVLAVDQWLRKRDLITRIDRRDFGAGRYIEHEILRVMEDCAVVVIFYSQYSQNRDYPQFEQKLAGTLRTRGQARVMYFCLDETPLPDTLEAAHLAIRASGKSFDAACQQLLSAILDIVMSPEDIDLSKYESRAPWQRRMVSSGKSPRRRPHR